MPSQPMASAVNYPCPLEVNVVNYVPIKLDVDKENYSLWKKLMLNLITSHQLVGFVDGTIEPPEEEQNQEQHRLWMRSDGLVKGWIFVTVTEEILLKQVRLNTDGEFQEVLNSSDESGKILPELVSLETAREVWIALEKILAPSESDSSDDESEDLANRYLPLYRAIRNGDWEDAAKFLEQEPNAVRDAITHLSETALMLAVQSSKRTHFVEKLIERMSPEDVARQDCFGQTALHKALNSGGHNVAAKLLVDKNRALPNIPNENGDLAVHYAAIQGNREMVNYLLEVIQLNGDPNPFDGKLGVQLFGFLIDGQLFDIASTFLQRYPKLASMKPSPLMRICGNPNSFRSGIRLNFFQHLIYSGIPLKSEGNANKPVGRDVENSAEGVVSPLGYLSQKLHAMFWDVAEKLVPTIKSLREIKLKNHQALKFVKVLCEEVVKSQRFSKASDIFHDPLFEAACEGTCEIVEVILELFPGALYFTDEGEQNIFLVAIENRMENVFNLIYQLDENEDIYLGHNDKFDNNGLHIAGNFGPLQQLSLQANVAGAALQMQRELQWFKAVEKLLHPKTIYYRNKDGKIPQEIFTETHRDLVEKGEKWMKDTASSCTIVAALIVTVVFAAAITVPGGINSNNGLPIFSENGVFVLFGVFDALALYSSTASLLMFLSIYTSRYGEQDFLYSLPRKLIIGLVTLFLSIISMMIAFGATLKITFGYERVWVVVVLSFVPITLFALLQFPLLLDMIRSTYYPGIFSKRSNRNLL